MGRSFDAAPAGAFPAVRRVHPPHGWAIILRRAAPSDVRAVPRPALAAATPRSSLPP
jgi:hypothetical protein